MEVKRTGYGHNISGTLGYVGGKHSPAHKNKNGVRRRNLAVAGIGVRTDTLHHTRRDFERAERLNPYKVKTVNFVLSPKKGTVDPHKPLEVQSFMDYSLQVAREAFPGHPVYIGVQADNQSMIVHSHLVVDYTDNTPQHHRLTGKTEDYHYLRKVARHVLNEPQFTNDRYLHIDTPTPEKRSPNTKPDYNEGVILRAVQPVLDGVDKGWVPNMKVFLQDCRSHGVIVTPRKVRRLKRDKHGNVMYHKYKNGHYRMRKNRRGRRVKEPIYTYQTGGLTFRFNPARKWKSNHKCEPVSAYRLSRYDNRCSLKYIQRTILNVQAWRMRRLQLSEETGKHFTNKDVKHLMVERRSNRAPATLNELENLYPNPRDRTIIFQLIPISYFAKYRDKWSNLAAKGMLKSTKGMYAAQFTSPGTIGRKTAEFVNYYRTRIYDGLRARLRKVQKKFRDFKDHVTVALNRGFHDLMDKAKQYIPDSFKKKFSNYVHLSPGVTLITKKYDSEAKTARKRLKVNGSVGFTKGGPHMSQATIRRVMRDYRLGKIREKRDKQREHRDAIRTKRKIQQTKRDIAKNNRELQNQNQPNRNHIHHDGPTLGG